jgi:hypothetical protein
VSNLSVTHFEKFYFYTNGALKFKFQEVNMIVFFKMKFEISETKIKNIFATI